MYWTAAQFLWRFFRKNKTQQERPYSAFFDSLIDKHQISLTGSDIQDIGSSFSDQDNAKAYAKTILEPRFIALREEFDELIKKNKEEISARAKTINEEIDSINRHLDDQNESGDLFKFEQEKENIKKRLSDIETICIPEIQLKPYVDKAVEQFKVNVEKIINSENDDGKVRTAAENQKIINAYISRESTNFWKLLDSFRAKIHSTHYPPRKRFIHFLYFLCLLLLICEVGLSMSIVRDISNIPFPQAWVRTSISIVYSIGISLMLASTYKIMIDLLLFKDRLKAFWFIFWNVIIIIVMMRFFSLEFRPNHESAVISRQGMVLGFFSACFALANGFLFREGTYLYDLYHKIYPNGNYDRIEKKKRTRRKELNKELNKKKTELLTVNKTDSEHQEDTERIYEYIERIKNINMTSFWIGFDSTFSKLVLNNHELTLSIIKNVKNKLYDEN